MLSQLAVICTLSAALTACGGGDGGGGSSATLAPFVKFSSIDVPGTVQINGSSQQVDYTYDLDTGTFTSISAVTPFNSNASVVVTYDSNGLQTKGVLNSAIGTTVTVDTANGGRIGYFSAFPNIGVGVSANNQDSILIARPDAFGWDYQTFGIWSTGTGIGYGTAGAASVGALTNGSSIPTSGSATYTGFSGGIYALTTPMGGYTYVASNMNATANFSTRSIAFATTNTITSRDLLTSTNNSNLNMSGTLSYSAGVNQFTGAVSSVGGGASNAAMTGNATGKFYGPSAQEIGGTFAVTGVDAGYIGAFGGKRP